MTTKLTHISDKKYNIFLEVPSHIVDETFKFFYSKAQAKYTIKGFRPGKAPLDMIIKNHQHEIEYNVLNHLSNKFLNEAIRTHKLRLINHSNTRVEQFAEGMSLKLFVEFEAQEDISIKNTDDNLVESIKEISVVKEKFKNDKIDEMVQIEIDKQREALSTRVPINEIRKVKTDEHCIIDCKCFYNNKLIDSLEDILFIALSLKMTVSHDENNDKDNPLDKTGNKNIVVTIPIFHTVDKIMNSFFKDQHFSEILKYKLAGIEVGQTKEFPVTYPSDHPLHSKTPFILQIHLKQICHLIFPEMDDAFAKKIGFSSVKNINKKLKQKYTDQEKKRIEEKLQTDILKELVNKNPVNIPEQYISIQEDHFTQSIKRKMLEKQGETQSHTINQKIEAWKKEGRFRHDAIYSISEGALVQKLANIWNLFEPIEREFKRNLKTNQQFSKIANKFQADLDPFKGQNKNTDQRDVMNPILFEMIKKSVVQQIISRANIQES